MPPVGNDASGDSSDLDGCGPAPVFERRFGSVSEKPTGFYHRENLS